MNLPAPEFLSETVALHRDVMIAMRDGVPLATDIYRPVQGGKLAEGPFPVLLERTPYGKHLPSRSEIEPGMTAPMPRADVAGHFVRHGYVVAYQDCRGRYRSGGAFTKYLSEGPDGFDSIGWLAGQIFCDGQVGTMGLSYAAHTQMAAACLAPAALRTMILDSGGFSNAFTCGIRQGGAFELKQATWAYNQAIEAAKAAGDMLALAALQAEPLFEWFRKMPWSEGRSPLRASPEYEAYLLEQWRNEVFDGYWQQNGIHAADSYEKIPDIPVALMSSWFDVYVPTTFENFAGLSASGKRPLTLIMGAGLHGDRNFTHAGDVDFGSEAPLSGQISESWLEFRRLWFDRWLKARDVSPSRASVNLFLMGGGSGRKNAAGRLDHGGRWIRGESWPLPGSLPLELHLHPRGVLAKEPPDGMHALRYVFDPDDPVPTIGGALTSGRPVFAGGGFDQVEDERFFGCQSPGLPLKARRDILSFETAPLAEDLAIAGPVIARLFVETDGFDTDFTAKLLDIHPPSTDYPRGFALILSDGILRCRFRDGTGQPRAVIPGEIMEIEIALFATANLFRLGHRIRLDISSSNFPKFDVNPNTGEAAGHAFARRKALNTLHFGKDAPSRLQVLTLPSL